MKDETNGVPISEFFGPRSKMYSFVCGGKESKGLKGISKVSVKKDLCFQNYKLTLFNETQKQYHMSLIRSHCHQIFCKSISINPVESYAYGHFKIKQLQN